MAENKQTKETEKIVSLKKDSEFYFRVGMKYANKKSTVNALKYFRKAVDLEPYNADYQFNLACILVELKQVESANEILLGILTNIDPTLTECYFGIGCNYFDLSNFKKAKEYIEKYIYFAPEGQFIEEAYDILYYLQIYYDMEAGKKSGRSILKLEKECRQLMAEGEYKKAKKKLETVIQSQPDSIWARNDLSVAYFFTGETDKAISIAKSSLRLKANDITALCNLTLFYSILKKNDLYKKHLEIINGFAIENKFEIMKIIETFVQLKEHKRISKLIFRYLKKNKEAFLFHFLAASYYNSKCFDKAHEAWVEFKKHSSHYKAIADYYIELNKATMEGKTFFKEIAYGTELPSQNDNELINPDIEDGLKAFIAKELGAKTEKKPSESDQGIIIKSISDLPIKDTKWKKEWESVIDCALQNKELSYNEGYGNDLKRIWINIVKKSYPSNEPKIKKREVWAAALEYIYCSLNLIGVTKTKIARKYNISANSLSTKLKDLNR